MTLTDLDLSRTLRSGEFPDLLGKEEKKSAKLKGTSLVRESNQVTSLPSTTMSSARPKQLVVDRVKIDPSGPDAEALLDELLDDDFGSSDRSPQNQPPKGDFSSKMSSRPAPHTPDTHTHTTTLSDSSAVEELNVADFVSFTETAKIDEHIDDDVVEEVDDDNNEDEGEVDSISSISSNEESVESSSSSSASAASKESSGELTTSLLERAHDRIALQHLQDEVKGLKAIIMRKDEEISTMIGQLRRAMSTKCDLVLAHTELERHHEFNLRQKDRDAQQIRRENFTILEERSELEKDLLNEIASLHQLLKDTEKKHMDELDDWERLHRNDMLEKDYEIAKLSEENRRLRGSAAQMGGGGSLGTTLRKGGLKVMFSSKGTHRSGH